MGHSLDLEKNILLVCEIPRGTPKERRELQGYRRRLGIFDTPCPSHSLDLEKNVLLIFEISRRAPKERRELQGYRRRLGIFDTPCSGHRLDLEKNALLVFEISRRVHGWPREEVKGTAGAWIFMILLVRAKLSPPKKRPPGF